MNNADDDTLIHCILSSTCLMEVDVYRAGHSLILSLWLFLDPISLLPSRDL